MSYDNLSSVSQNVLKFYYQLTGEERRIPFIFDERVVHSIRYLFYFKLVLLWAQLTKIYPPLPTSVQPISITKTLLIVPTKNELSARHVSVIFIRYSESWKIGKPKCFKYLDAICKVWDQVNLTWYR
jgi:hypothetical protein